MAGNISFNPVPQVLVDEYGKPTMQFLRFLQDIWKAVNASPDTLAGLTTRTSDLETDLSMQQYHTPAIQGCGDFGGALTDGYFIWWNAGAQRFEMAQAVATTLGPTVEVDAAGTTIASAPTDKLAFFGGTPVVQQVSAALTNNVTAGGSSDVIANFTDLTVYANDAAAIRNDIYQLARKVKEIGDALRAYEVLG